MTGTPCLHSGPPEILYLPGLCILRLLSAGLAAYEDPQEKVQVKKKKDGHVSIPISLKENLLEKP